MTKRKYNEVEIIVLRCSGRVNEIAKGVVVVRVRDRAARIRQRAHAAMAVVIEVPDLRGERSVDHHRSPLADPLQPVHIGHRRRRVLRFFRNHLRITRRIQRVDETACLDAFRRFPARNAIPKPGQNRIADHIRIPRQRYSLATPSVTAVVLTFETVTHPLSDGYTYK